MSRAAGDLLASAQALILKRENWRKGSLGGPDAPCCALGAISAAAGIPVLTNHYSGRSVYQYPLDVAHPPEVDEAVARLAECAAKLAEIDEDTDHETAVIQANDDEDTTHSDVIQMFDCAIDRAYTTTN